MPDHPKLDEWQERVEYLCAQIVKRPELTWLWEIRIKILMYLIHRYGETTASQSDVSLESQRRTRTMIRPRPLPRRSRCIAARREQIRALLGNIRRVNCESKAVR